MDSLDCGPCCIDMVATHYGFNQSRQVLRSLCDQDRQGTSLGGLARAAQAIGFRTSSVRTTMSGIAQAKLPCIAYQPGGHFVVIYACSSRRIYVADPAAGKLTYTHEEFATVWLIDRPEGARGVLLLLDPTDQLRKTRDSGSTAVAHNELLVPFRAALRRHYQPLIVGALVLMAAQAILPFLSASLIDAGISNRDVALLYAILVGQLVLLATRVSVEVLQEWLLAHAGLQLHTTLVSRFLRKLSRLPFAFFRNKLVGDTIQRVEDHKTIQQVMTDSLGRLFLAGLSFLVFGTVLAIFSWRLFAIFAVGSALYLGYSAGFLSYLMRLNYKEFTLISARHSALYQFLSGIEEIKLNNATEYFRLEWERTQLAVARVQRRTQLLSVLQMGGGTAINEAKNITLVVAAALMVADNEMTLGTMIAVQYVVGQLNWPLAQVFSLMGSSNAAYMSYIRAREVHEIKEEDSGLTGTLQDTAGGNLRLVNASFRYRGHGLQEDAIKNVSVEISAGKVTAIVGKSGSGKSTLLRLLMRMYPLDDGELMCDDKDLQSFPARSWREHCGIVLQDGKVFSDTIYRNVSLSEETDFARADEALRVAQASEFIDALPLGAKTRVGSEGVGLSSGQLQRILIARALYRNPKYIFLDEATSALDAATEARVMLALRHALKGRTSVIVAHRLSTIREADNIIVLNDGIVVEQGDHDSLVAARGHYYDLVRQQLDQSADSAKPKTVALA